MTVSGTQSQRGFTLLECMIALALIATALVIVIESQAFAINMEEKANRINTASMLASDIMVDLELRMMKEGFGELEVRETGTFNDQRYADAYPAWRWEYEVEKVELEVPNLPNLMNMVQGEVADGEAPPNELAALESMGIDLSFFGEYMGNFLREARVRICYPDGYDKFGDIMENCLEVSTHLVNPTGKVLTEEEQLLLEAQEDAQIPPVGP